VEPVGQESGGGQVTSFQDILGNKKPFGLMAKGFLKSGSPDW
jgi:hypothetical protein